ncbi:MAG: tetratricopeptide repeat protein [bacterium]
MIRLFILAVILKSSFGFKDPQFDSQVRLCIDFIMNHSYSKADSICSLVINKNPDHPAGYAMSFLLCQYKMLDYFDTTGLNKCSDIFKKGLSVTEKKIKLDSDDTVSLYFRAVLYGARSYMNVKFGNYFKGFSDGIISVKLYNRLIKLSPGCCDAQGSLGTYYYWKGVYLNFLPFFDEERSHGIQMLERAVKCFSYLRSTSIYSYLWVKFHEREYEKALEITETILEKYKSNRSFKRSKADCLFNLKEWRKAEKIYKDLLNDFKNPPFSRVYYIEILAKLAHIAEMTGRMDDYVYYLKAIISCPVNEWEKGFVEKQLAWAGYSLEELGDK